MDKFVKQHTHTSRIAGQSLRWLVLALAAMLALLFVTGCPTSVKPLTGNAFRSLGTEMIAIEAQTAGELATSLTESAAQLKRSKNPDARARITFLRGYMEETLQAKRAPDERDYANAYARYREASAYDTGYIAQSRYRMGLLAANELVAGSDINPAKPQTKPTDEAKKSLQTLAHQQGGLFGSRPDVLLWVRQPELAGIGGLAELSEITDLEDAQRPLLFADDAPGTVTARLDMIYRTGGGLDQTYHRLVKGYVAVFRKLSPAYGPALALIFLSLLIKIVTFPMTTASYRGMRDMQRVQPLLKQLQEKYKDDKAKLAQEQMQLMKDHKVSPLGGCLPMLIQLPIFWVVYRAVLVYAEGFANAKFLWINNLAGPDSILLILYAISMIISQKLTTMPTADPAMQQQQKMMTYMLPIMLLFLLSSLASAFVLYWFFLNVFSAVHQYYMMKKFKDEEAAKAALAVPAPVQKKGKKS